MNPDAQKVAGAQKMRVVEKIEVVLRDEFGNVKDVHVEERGYSFADILSGKIALDDFAKMVADEIMKKINIKKPEESK